MLTEDLEIKLLLEGLVLQSGFDFRNYTRHLVKQRALSLMRQRQLKSISELQAKVLRDPDLLDQLVVELAGRHTELFADPGFYSAFRQQAVPWLRTYPFARIWVAGCAGGAEAYSLAIILLEEGLQARCRLYATDLNEMIVRQAQGAFWPVARIKQAAKRYAQAGGRRTFPSYFSIDEEGARPSAILEKNIVWAAHNPVTDASFNEFHAIVCRELMTDLDPILQSQMHDLLFGSLSPRGLLMLKPPQHPGTTLHAADYETLDADHGIYRKIRLQEGTHELDN